MPTDVLEMRGGNPTGSIRSDTELTFPNVQSCMALVAVSGVTMAGVHVTLADRNRLGEVVVALRNFIGGDATLYVVGPTTDYNMPALGNARGFEPHCYVDVRAHLTGGLEFYVRPMGGAGAWQRLDMALFN
jgi:hypothetical protein